MSSASSPARVTPADLARLLDEASGGAIRLEDPDDLRRPLSELPLSSMMWVAFLSMAGTRYDFSWEDSSPPEAFHSLESLAAFMSAGTVSGEQ